MFFKKSGGFLTFVLSISALYFMSVPFAFAAKCKFCGIDDAKLAEKHKVCTGCQVEHYCNQKCQKKHWRAHSSVCEKVASLKGGVRIDESAFSGKGLFAERKFEVGEPIAVYTGEYNSETFAKKLEHLSSVYATDTPESGTLFGTSKPRAPHVAMQLANDALISSESVQKLYSPDCKHMNREYIKDVVNIYNEYSAKSRRSDSINNSKCRSSNHFTGLSFPVYFATKTILPGAEIFNAYGADYWTQIPSMICARKGHPIEAWRLVRALLVARRSNPATQPSEVGKIQREIEKIDNFIQSCADNILACRISSLVADPATFNVRIVNEIEFENMAREIDLEGKLREISDTPNSEFYDSRNHSKIHEKSKALFKAMLDFVPASNDIIFMLLKEDKEIEGKYALFDDEDFEAIVPSTHN